MRRDLPAPGPHSTGNQGGCARGCVGDALIAPREAGGTVSVVTAPGMER